MNTPLYPFIPISKAVWLKMITKFIDFAALTLSSARGIFVKVHRLSSSVACWILVP